MRFFQGKIKYQWLFKQIFKIVVLIVSPISSVFQLCSVNLIKLKIQIIVPLFFSFLCNIINLISFLHATDDLDALASLLDDEDGEDASPAEADETVDLKKKLEDMERQMAALKQQLSRQSSGGDSPAAKTLKPAATAASTKSPTVMNCLIGHQCFSKNVFCALSVCG